MWGSRGLRGSDLEQLIEFTNNKYSQLGICRVDKVATPVKAVEISNDGVITRGFFEKKSTVDFVGVIQGVFIAFDVKETKANSLPLKNVHEHQIKYMQDVKAQGGLAFIIVHFKKYDEYYLIPLDILLSFSDKKSIPYSSMGTCIRIDYNASMHLLEYIDALNILVSLD